MPIEISPSGTPILAHSLLVIPNLPAAIMLGIFPGINIPPEIKSPISALFICDSVRAGPISAAARVALSRMAETMLTQ